MRSSATSSSCARRRAATGRLAALVLATATVAGGTVLITVEEALRLAFPGAELVRETLFLTDEQRRAAAAAAGLEVDGAMVTRFVARDAGRTVGFGYLDSHLVRTLPETLVVILDAEGAVQRVEVAAFREPLDYKPGDRWYRQFDGRNLDRDLELDRAIRPVTGATLTARATTDAVRRVLAIHRSVTEPAAAP